MRPAEPYSYGRCDFSPSSYTFDNVTGDTQLHAFDDSVAHDVASGMIPMIQAAQAALRERGEALSLFASPWSPPAWMKAPVGGVAASMCTSAAPNGLLPSMQRAWARYFSRFISAYRARGVEVWGVTPQNEPEAAVGWEACLMTPGFQAAFVRDHLGPVLAAEQPGVRIVGFDHNKDHALTWARALYADPVAYAYFAGVGVHWYGGLHPHNLDAVHALAPDKFILGTEACNCGGVAFRSDGVGEWWARGERLALDILVDLTHHAVGWWCAGCGARTRDPARPARAPHAESPRARPATGTSC